MSFQTQIRFLMWNKEFEDSTDMFPCNYNQRVQTFKFQKGWKRTMKVVQMTVFQVFWSHTLALCEEQIKIEVSVYW